jgi:hypothetical protein
MNLLIIPHVGYIQTIKQLNNTAFLQLQYVFLLITVGNVLIPELDVGID